MDSGQNDYLVKSREEYIRMARESCLRNLHQESTNNKNDLHKKDLHKQYNFGAMQNQRDTGVHLFTGINLQNKTLKFFLIRTICALVLFLAILMIDKFDLSIKTFHSEYIEKTITSNLEVEKAEDFIISMISKLTKEDK